MSTSPKETPETPQGNRVPKRGLPLTTSAASKRKSVAIYGPCIVGEKGAYSIIKILLQKTPSSTPEPEPTVPVTLVDLGIESRACEWMTKDLFTSFFRKGASSTEVVAVVSVKEGSLAEQAGVVYKDVIAYPSNGVWKLLGSEQVQNLYLKQYHKNGGMVLFVARKLSLAEKSSLPYAYESNVTERLLDMNRTSTRTPSKRPYNKKPKPGSPPKKDVVVKPVKTSRLSEKDENAVRALLSIPSTGKQLPGPPPKATQTITRNELQENDVVLSVGGYDRGLYSQVIRDWWERYELAGHSQKRHVVREVVREMHARGVRFLIKHLIETNLYMIEPEGSLRVSNKVLRALRQEVITQTESFTTNQRKAREEKIQLLRQAARQRKNRREVTVVTDLSKTINGTKTITMVSPQQGDQN